VALTRLPKEEGGVQYVCLSNRTLKARFMLVDIYLTNEKRYTPLVEEVVREINQAVSERDRYNYRNICVRYYEKKKARKDGRLKDDDQ
jgi:hypothetical protein